MSASPFTMSISIFLATLAACTFLLDKVAATVVITAPSTVIDRTGELETREQGPTAWICSALLVESPWTAYANIQGYLEGGNAQGKNYNDLVLSPVMELFYATQDQSRLCVYLPAEDHCYPSAPSTGSVKAVKQLTKRTYFAIRFWGQASNARVQYYRQKLTKALITFNKVAKLDLFFVSFFSDHVREVRYDPVAAMIEPSNDRAPTGGLVVSTTTVVPVVPTLPTSKTASVKFPFPYQPESVPDGSFSPVEIDPARLEMFDVQLLIIKETLGRAKCPKLAGTWGFDAYIDRNTSCYLYNFGKDFYACTGQQTIQVNRKRLEMTQGRWQNLPHPNQQLKEIIIYSEFPPVELFQPLLSDKSSASATAKCETALLALPVKKASISAIITMDRCFVSTIHDAASCNQTCKGQPMKALVRNVNPNPIVHFLSNCGKKLQVTAKSELESSIYLSHPGTGCYYYPQAKSLEEEDCVITFEKAPTAQTLEVVFDYVNLDRYNIGCQDQLMVYTGRTMGQASLLKYLCRDEPKRVSVKDAVTINFHRVQKFAGSGKMGFRLSIFNA